jgi:hypothetical protein
MSSRIGQPFQPARQSCFAALVSPAAAGYDGTVPAERATCGRQHLVCRQAGEGPAGNGSIEDDAIASKMELSPDRYGSDATPPVVPDENGSYPCAMPGITKVV